jgi:predicted RNase H-like HicB family nuclease
MIFCKLYVEEMGRIIYVVNVVTLTTLTTYIIIGGENMKTIIKGGDKMEALVKRKFNIRDTKRYYSDLNSAVLNGLELVTFKGINKNVRNEEEVSHIKTEYVDYLMGFLKFTPIIELGEEVGGYTISLNEIDIYGEGDTLDEAKENLLDSILEYIDIYVDKLDLFNKVESTSKQVYMLKLIRCDGDRDRIKKEIGL